MPLANRIHKWHSVYGPTFPFSRSKVHCNSFCCQFLIASLLHTVYQLLHPFPTGFLFLFPLSYSLFLTLSLSLALSPVDSNLGTSASVKQQLVDGRWRGCFRRKFWWPFFPSKSLHVGYVWGCMVEFNIWDDLLEWQGRRRRRTLKMLLILFHWSLVLCSFLLSLSLSLSISILLSLSVYACASFFLVCVRVSVNVTL